MLEIRRQERTLHGLTDLRRKSPDVNRVPRVSRAGRRYHVVRPPKENSKCNLRDVRGGRYGGRSDKRQSQQAARAKQTQSQTSLAQGFSTLSPYWWPRSLAVSCRKRTGVFGVSCPLVAPLRRSARFPVPPAVFPRGSPTACVTWDPLPGTGMPSWVPASQQFFIKTV